jgi:hypothetical protein
VCGCVPVYRFGCTLPSYFFASFFFTILSMYACTCSSCTDSGHAFRVVRFMLDNFEQLFGEEAQQAKLEREATAFLEAEAAPALLSPAVPRQSDPIYQKRRESVMLFQGEFTKGKHKLSAQWTPEVIRQALDEVRAESSGVCSVWLEDVCLCAV